MTNRCLTSICSSLVILFTLALILAENYSKREVNFVMAFSTQMICSKIPGLTPKQRNLCLNRPDAIVAVGDGAKLALKECQQQFFKHRWNCSSISKNYLFGQDFNSGSREAAYTTAVYAAGIAFKITVECSRGSLARCQCDPNKNKRSNSLNYFPTNPGSYWKWGGCSDHVRYGMRFSSNFLDEREHHRKYHKERTLMNLHNNRAGRKAVKVTMRTNCKCSGVSGSCTIKTCWKMLPNFSKVGTYLKYKYHSAKKVEALLGYRRTSRRKTPLYLKLSKSIVPMKKPRRKDLVFLENSPNYCEKTHSSVGTKGRSCNKNSDGPDNCELLCCGRGYNVRRYVTTQHCHCKFHWCCHVTCKQCMKNVTEYYCK